jgi:hypothetical protein
MNSTSNLHGTCHLWRLENENDYLILNYVVEEHEFTLPLLLLTSATTFNEFWAFLANYSHQIFTTLLLQLGTKNLTSVLTAKLLTTSTTYFEGVHCT